MSTRGRITGLALVTTGVATILLVHWMVAFWVPNEASQGVVQRIFYIHVPAAWTTFLAVGIVAVASAVYLWLEDERADAAAVAAAEGALVFGAIMLITGPLWARVAWNTYWQWDPRLTLTLILWFTYLGYFLVRGSVVDPRRGKRFAAVVAVVGSLNIPLIHVSVEWFRSIHPEPTVLKPDGPTLPSDMLATLLTSLAGFTLLFLGLFTFRYAVERLRRRRPAVVSGETDEALT
ncbi:MAG: cytochrome c biogenesis protein [Gemmatimonadota bacterium]|nr:cytochrome c biogenesis protein [Gemmatimonadota bacterium]MDE2983159.1 cytochrome c biogenesis protein [Gemmatimonadota bacterium]